MRAPSLWCRGPLALPAWQLSGTFPATVACGFPLVTAGFCLWASALHPPFFFLPWRHLVPSAVQVPFTAAASVIVTGGLEQLPPVSVAMLPTLLPQGLSALPSSLVATTADATPLLPLPPLVFTLTPVLYTADKKGQLFTTSTAASRDMAAQDLVLGGPVTWV